MAQAQVDLDLEGKIEKGNSHRSVLQGKRRSPNVRKSFGNLKTACHSLPLVVKIQSTPLEDVLNTQVFLENDWIVYIGGPEGENFQRTHLNIRRKNIEGNVGVDSSGIAMPLVMIECLQKALETITDGYKLFHSKTVNSA